MRYSCILWAASLPWAIALTTRLSPVTTSPAAKTPGSEVIRFSSMAMAPFGPVAIPVAFWRKVLGPLPMATITESHSMSMVSPVGTGLLLPLASISPSFITVMVVLVTRPPSPT